MMFNGAPPNCSGAAPLRSIAAALPAMVRAPQPFQRILRSDATLAGWAARRDREEALAGIVRRHLPRPLAAPRFASRRNETGNWNLPPTPAPSLPSCGSEAPNC